MVEALTQHREHMVAPPTKRYRRSSRCPRHLLAARAADGVLALEQAMAEALAQHRQHMAAR